MPSVLIGMSEAYSVLAKFYDGLMEVDYDQWIRYLLVLSETYGHQIDRIIELGCGTGNLSIPLKKLGYEIKGVDLSAEMIAMAEIKAREAGLKIPFFVHDLRELHLPNELFDTVISACDVLNYITTKDALVEAFYSVHRLLEPGGFWFFDLNSAYKLQEIYGDISYADLETDFAYFWDNRYDWNENICTMDLTFFVENKAGSYQRVAEQHHQKLWMPDEIEAISRETGFRLLACYDFLTTDRWGMDTERWQFILRKE